MDASDSLTLTDAHKCQYRCWVHECCCERGSLTQTHKKRNTTQKKTASSKKARGEHITCAITLSGAIALFVLAFRSLTLCKLR